MIAQQPTAGFQVAGEAPLSYERHIALFLGASAEILTHLAAPKPGDRALDAACGTGFVARRLLPHVVPGGGVVGIDINEPMLEVARRFSPPAIDWQVGDLQALDVPDASLDVVVCQHGLQFAADPARAAAELVRVLAPEGRLVASVWPEQKLNPYHNALGNAVEEYFGPAARATWPRGFSVGDEAALRDLFFGAQLSAVSVRGLEIEARLPNLERFVEQHLAATPWAGDFQALADVERQGFLAAIAAELRPYRDGDGIVVPFTHLVITGVSGEK